MTKTSTASRYRLIVRNQGEMAQVEDTCHRDFGMRGRSAAVTPLLPYAEAATIKNRLNAS